MTRTRFFAGIACCMLIGAVPGIEAAQTPPPPKERSSTIQDLSEMEAREIATDIETWPGAAIYKRTCAQCHEGQVPKAPQKVFLQMLSGPTILRALNEGLMKPQGSLLSADQRKHVSEYLSGAKLEAAHVTHAPPQCKGSAAQFDSSMRPLRTGWGYSNARFVPGAEAKLTPAQVSQLKLKWAFEFPNALRARSQPHIAYGALYVGSHDGTVYALDLETGCVRWTFKASGEVRTAVVPHEATESSDRAMAPRVYFGDVLARVYSVDAFTGKLQWSLKVDDHPNATVTATPAFDRGVLYVPVSSLEVTSAADAKYECCTFRGSIVALDAWTGVQRWKSYTISEKPQVVKTTSLGTRVFAPSGAPVWNSPTIDAKRGLLYVGTGENYSSPANDRSDALMAFQLADGKLVWSHQMLAGDAWNVGCMMKDNPNCPVENGPDVDFGAGTILVPLQNGREVLVAGQKNGMVFGLDPDERGKLLWSTRVGRGGIQGGVHFGMASEGARVYAPISDMTDDRNGGANPSPPLPGILAVDAASGQITWTHRVENRCGQRKFCDPGISAAVTAIPGAVFAGHMDGVFRAYEGATGKTLFEFDSTQEVATVSGAKTRGGSFGGAGAAVRNGYVAVNSGYGLYFHMPGNVLLVFGAP